MREHKQGKRKSQRDFNTKEKLMIFLLTSAKFLNHSMFGVIFFLNIISLVVKHQNAGNDFL